MNAPNPTAIVVFGSVAAAGVVLGFPASVWANAWPAKKKRNENNEGGGNMFSKHDVTLPPLPVRDRAKYDWKDPCVLSVYCCGKDDIPHKKVPDGPFLETVGD